MTRFVVILTMAMAAVVAEGCGPSFDVVTGKFDGGKLIALNMFVGANTTSGVTTIEAYAEVPEQTPGVLDISGPQHWRCSGTFRVLPGRQHVRLAFRK